MRRSGQTCDRAREWASLRMDGELSELESALLEAHLKRCEACGSFAVEVEAVALQLRAASLERIEPPKAHTSDFGVRHRGRQAPRVNPSFAPTLWCESRDSTRGTVGVRHRRRVACSVKSSGASDLRRKGGGSPPLSPHGRAPTL